MLRKNVFKIFYLLDYCHSWEEIITVINGISAYLNKNKMNFTNDICEQCILFAFTIYIIDWLKFERTDSKIEWDLPWDIKKSFPGEVL